MTSAHDGFGRPASSSTNMGGVARMLAYQYDRGGSRTRIAHPDGVQFDYAYDGLGRPTTLTDPALALNHLYEPWGTVSAIVRNGAGSGRWTTPDGRLISLTHYNGPSFTLDALWGFTHNPAGQIASQTGANDAYAWTGAYAVNRPYTTNGLNQYSQTGTGAGTTSFTYDANGNLITETLPSPAPARSYVYDIENRLVGASGGVVLSYDPLGRLYSVSSPTSDTRFLYDGDALVAEYNAAGTLLRRYVHDIGADVPAIQYEGTTVSASTRRYLLSGPQGSIVASTNGNSVIQTRNSYDEYGIPASNNTGRFQYTGQIWLPELGMYHYKARVYSPTLGRFLQVDPIGYDDQFNLYAYVANDPVNGADPSGMAQCTGSHISCPDGGTAPGFSGSSTGSSSGKPRQTHRPRTYAADSGGGGGSQPQSTIYSITINVEEGPASGSASSAVGHAWIQVQTITDGRQIESETFGLMPMRGRTTTGYSTNVRRNQDVGRRVAESRTLWITREMYRSVLNEERTRQFEYSDLGYNCVDFALYIWNRATGQQLSATSSLGASTPATLIYRLRTSRH